MAEKQYECLRSVSLGPEKSDKYAPGDPISKAPNDVIEKLLISGAVGEKGSFKKLQAEEEVKAVGDPEAVKKLVDDLRNQIADLKVDNQKLLERNAELGKKTTAKK